MGGSECAMLSKWIICVSESGHVMGTMGGMDYEFVMFHRQMENKEFKTTPPTSFGFPKLFVLFS